MNLQQQSTNRQPLPRWVKLAVAVTVLALLGIALMLIAGGHQPGQHIGNHSAPASTAPQ